MLISMLGTKPTVELYVVFFHKLATTKTADADKSQIPCKVNIVTSRKKFFYILDSQS